MNIALLTQSSAGSSWSLIITVVVMLVMMWFLIYLPQRRQNKKDAQMRNSMDIGDEVTTIGGIVGRVVAIKDDTFVLETGSDRVKIRFRKSAVASLEKLDMDEK